MGPTIAQQVLRGFSALPGKQTPLVDELTPRDMELLKLLAQGRSNRERAAAAIRSNTVRY